MLTITHKARFYIVCQVATLYVFTIIGCAGNGQNTNTSITSSRTKWSYQASESDGVVPGTLKGLAANGDHILAGISVPNLAGAVIALNPKDGARLWIASPLDTWHGGSGPITAGSRVFTIGLRGTNTSDVTVFGLSGGDGRVLWKNPLNLRFANQNPLLADTDRVYVRGLVETGATKGERLLLALSAETGKPVWRVEALASPAVALAPDAERLYIGTQDGILVVLDTRSGREVQRYKLSEGPVVAVLLSGNLVTWLDLDGVQIVDLSTGKALWKKQVSLDARGPFWPHNKFLAPMTKYPARLTGNRLYYMTVAASEVRAVEFETGKPVWSHPIPKDVDPSVFEVVGNHVVYATHNDTEDVNAQEIALHWLDSATGTVQATDTIQQAHIPGRTDAMVHEGNLLITTRSSVIALTGP